MYNNRTNNLSDEELVNIAFLIIEYGYSIRYVRKVLNLSISKSTIWNNLRKRISVLDNELFEALCVAFKKNFSEKHFRGGLSTQNKFRKRFI